MAVGIYEKIKKNTKSFIIIAIAVTTLLILAVWYVISQINSNDELKEFKISNITSVTKMPSSTRSVVQQTLYKTIRNNLSYNEQVPSSGAIIRDSKLIDQKDTERMTTYVKFIVDIESIQQSYLIQAEWFKNQKDQKDGPISGYPVVVSCLSGADIIYKDFNCIDYQTINLDLNGVATAKNGVEIIGLARIKENGIADAKYQNLYEAIASYYNVVYANQKNLIVDAKSIKSNEDKINLDLYAPDKSKFHLDIELKGDEFSFTLFDQNDQIYTYDSSLYEHYYNLPAGINNRYLPYYGETENGKKYTFLYNRKGQYELSLDNCGDQNIKNEAKTALSKWLKDKNYNIDDFEIVIPNYCDRELGH